MVSEDREKWKRFCSYAGCFSILLPHSLPWYWGNLSAYTNSYFRTTLGPDSGFQTPWIISIFFATVAIGVLCCSLFYRRIGHRLTCFMASLVFDIAMSLNYVLVQTSYEAMIVTVGIVCGLCTGIINGTVLHVVKDWTPSERVGTFTSIILGSNNVGPLLLNQIITLYINPRNLLPDLAYKSSVYFAQSEVVNRVPSSFLVLSSICLGFQILGLSLLKSRPEDETFITGYTGLPDQSKGHNFGKTQGHEIIEQDKKPTETSYFNEQALGSFQAQSHVLTMASTKRPRHELSQCITCQMEFCPDCTPGQTITDRHTNGFKNVLQTENTALVTEFTTLEMIKSPSFYSLWFLNICSNFNYIILTNFYKLFGQTKIHDDHFLTNLTIVTLSGATMFRIFWGWLLDKVGIKYTSLIMSSVLCFASAFWYFTPLVNKWLYMVWTSLFGSFNSGVSILFPLATLRVFGASHYTVNYGVVLSATIVVNMAGPPVIDLILEHGGWFVLFISGTGLRVLGLALFLIVFPKS